MQAKGSCAGRTGLWEVRKTQVSTGMHKAPDQTSRNYCMATDLNEYTKSTFFPLHVCVRQKGGGE